MNQTQRSPNRAETGLSENIHLRAANDTYRIMISENQLCEKFCIEVLERFDLLLERFLPNSNPRFNGNELDVFVALVNLERSIESQAAQS